MTAENAKDTAPYKGRRGDLAVIERRNSYTVLGEGARESVSYAVMLVTSVTRDGHVKAVKDVRWGDDVHVQMTKNMVGVLRILAVPKDTVDVARAMEAVRAHTYPGSTTPMDYNSLDEVRAVLRPYVTGGSAG